MESRTPRRDLGSPVGLLYHGLYTICPGLEISEGGLGVAVDLAMRAEDQAVVTLTLPGAVVLIVRVSVRYQSPKKQHGLPVYGLVFQGLSVQDRRFVRSYISAKTAHAS